MTPTPRDDAHPHADACEDVAEDLAEVWSEAERLRALVEAKLARVAGAGEAGAKRVASKLTALRESLERTLADVDARTDEVAGRFPRRPSAPRQGHGWT